LARPRRVPRAAVKEIAGLRREDIFEESDPPVLVVNAGKGGHQRIIPLNPYVLRALRLAGLPRSGYVFVSSCGDCCGRPIQRQTVSKLMSRYLRDAGVTGTAHSLRHRFATEVYRKSQDIRVTQEMLGHSSPETTARYAAYSPVAAATAVVALAPPKPTRGADVPDGERAEADRLAAAMRPERELATLLPRFRESLEAEGYAVSTADQIVQLLVRLEGWLMPENTVVDATAEDLARFLADRGVKPGALANYLSRLRQFYGWARGDGLVRADPTVRLRVLMRRDG
jgi:site-specific recombinase XerD